MDECWVTLKLNLKAHNGSTEAHPGPKKAEVMLSVFWDCRGALLTDYACKGQTITAEYYCEMHSKHSAGSMAQMTHAASSGYEIVPHPPCSPDQVTSSSFLAARETFSGRRRSHCSSRALPELSH